MQNSLIHLVIGCWTCCFCGLTFGDDPLRNDVVQTLVKAESDWKAFRADIDGALFSAEADVKINSAKWRGEFQFYFDRSSDSIAMIRNADLALKTKSDPKAWVFKNDSGFALAYSLQRKRWIIDATTGKNLDRKQMYATSSATYVNPILKLTGHIPSLNLPISHILEASNDWKFRVVDDLDLQRGSLFVVELIVPAKLVDPKFIEHAITVHVTKESQPYIRRVEEIWTLRSGIEQQRQCNFTRIADSNDWTLSEYLLHMPSDDPKTHEKIDLRDYKIQNVSKEFDRSVFDITSYGLPRQ